MATEANAPLGSANDVVLSFIKALNEEDFEAARSCAADDLKFIGVLGQRDGAEAYFTDMQRMKLKYDIKRVFSDGDDVCIFYDIDMGRTTIFSCGWYHVVDGKINSIRVIFDPRPLL
ncbi:nuclear transport factor 2 family protein [Mucilaginibacter sp. cycad4]|uniref:nuclear transport factor 2 family protein n=1 Tax=Mucilaginibacter sp. cycad4 TaxID=3342096 RepID=UPI002AAAC20D|nr:nuclear transport factor 2 family protein [Mucilaginibacter gossypii]WPV00423.1 nuclear transport factor 2 family protein [Mucilaginibacter gossypii]